jgi:hypothetical protein
MHFSYHVQATFPRLLKPQSLIPPPIYQLSIVSKLTDNNTQISYLKFHFAKPTNAPVMFIYPQRSDATQITKPLQL